MRNEKKKMSNVIYRERDKGYYEWNANMFKASAIG